MNILFITHLYPGKPEHSEQDVSFALHDFVKIWRNNGNEVLVVRPMFPTYRNLLYLKPLFEGDLPEQYTRDGIEIKNMKFYRIPKTSNPILLSPKIDFKPNIVVGHMQRNFKLTKQIARSLEAPYVLGIHNSDLPHLSKFNVEFTLAKAIACRSLPIKNRFLDVMPQYANKIFVANSGIDCQQIEDDVFFSEKAKTILQTKELLFVTVSRLIKLKNIDITIKALAKYKDQNWQYYIIGDGEEKEYLESLIQQHGLNERIHILGWRSRNFVLDFLTRTHYFILVSAPETFGLAYLEAMAKGNIIIGCLNWGISGIVINEKNGFLLKERDQNGLETLFARIFSNKIEAEKIMKNEETTIHEYTQQNMGEKYQAMLEHLLHQDKGISINSQIP